MVHLPLQSIWQIWRKNHVNWITLWLVPALLGHFALSYITP
jgi:hypothetical protein